MTTNTPLTRLATLPLFSVMVDGCMVHSVLNGEPHAMLWQESRGAERFLRQYVATQFDGAGSLLEIETLQDMVAVLQLARNEGQSDVIVFGPPTDVGAVVRTEDLLLDYLTA